jgi:hypothetical protein
VTQRSRPAVRIESTWQRRASVVAFGVVWTTVLVGLLNIRLIHGLQPVEWLVAVAVFATLLLVWVRFYRVVVVAEPAGLLIRNTFSTRRFRWDDIERFEIDEPDSPLDPWQIVCHRRSGRKVVLEATRRVNLSPRSRQAVETYLRDLQAWLPG